MDSCSTHEPKVLVEGTNDYILDRDYHYRWSAHSHIWRITVPMGFRFDGASLPWATQLFIGKWDLGKGPPCVHDWLYRYRGQIPDESLQVRRGDDWVGLESNWSRYDCDRLFARHMRSVGVAKWKRRSAYFAIRAGGWWAWYSQGGIIDGDTEGTR